MKVIGGSAHLKDTNPVKLLRKCSSVFIRDAFRGAATDSGSVARPGKFPSVRNREWKCPPHH